MMDKSVKAVRELVGKSRAGCSIRRWGRAPTTTDFEPQSPRGLGLSSRRRCLGGRRALRRYRWSTRSASGR